MLKKGLQNWKINKEILHLVWNCEFNILTIKNFVRYTVWQTIKNALYKKKIYLLYLSNHPKTNPIKFLIKHAINFGLQL